MTRAQLAILAIAMPVALWLSGNSSAQQDREQKRDPATDYEIIVPGLLGNRVTSVQFKSLPLRLDQRDLIMGRGEAKGVPTLVRMLLELRGGSVTTTVNGQSVERRQGDFWEVAQGVQLDFKNTGDVAVIRVIYIHDGRR